jgi:hypothetical protein
MGDHLSPLIQGFTNPTMITLYDMIKTSTKSLSELSPNLKIVYDLVQQQQELADSLMSSAKKIGPVSQKIITSEDAYDAAFETDVAAALPSGSSSLQGFTLFFFILSFLSLAIVASINVNFISGSVFYAIGTFVSFLVLFILSIALINRFA